MDEGINGDSLQEKMEALGREVLETFYELRRSESVDLLASVKAAVAADLIYVIDHAIEERIVSWLDQHWPSKSPIKLVMEGLEEPLTLPRSTRARPVLTLIIDPIDGTREIMWDRRSAWFLAALADHLDGQTSHLKDVAIAVMVELPPTRHRGSFMLSTSRNGPLRSRFREDPSGQVRAVELGPFQGESLAHGFISFGTPFFQGKARISRFAEVFIARYFGQPLDSLPIFDDQYISTGGQLFDLMTGRLRLVGDLRPRFLAPPGERSPLPCHPYDICTALLAQSLGCIIEAPDGSPLDPPLDTTTPVAWMGYANESIAARARPIVRELLPTLTNTSQ